MEIAKRAAAAARAEAAREEAARAEAARDGAAEMEAALAVLAVHGRGAKNMRLLERIKCLILLARSFEIRLDSTDERWKHQVEQNTFLLNQVSVLKSRLDTLDAEKLAAEQKVATWNVRLVYATIGATAAWVVHLTMT
jgi:hypothetical protein